MFDKHGNAGRTSHNLRAPEGHIKSDPCYCVGPEAPGIFTWCLQIQQPKFCLARDSMTSLFICRPIAAIAVASPPITRAVTMPLVHPSVPPPFPLRIPTPPATVKPYPMHVF